MPDWSKSMIQTYEYHIVDPKTWKDIRQLTTVKPGSQLTRDLDSDTLGSATFNIVDSVGECYIRAYLKTIQNGVEERHPLGTYLVQTPTTSFDGKVRNVTMDAYTPLLELKENPPPLGYSMLKGDNIMEGAYKIIREQARAPVVKPMCSDTLRGDFVANTDDTWITFIRDLIANANYNLGLDEMGRIIFLPDQEVEALQPVWTYTDDNSSILLPSLSMNHDLYGIPNVVEVACTVDDEVYYSKVVNDDPNSPTSTINRGRAIFYRDTNPSISGNPTQKMIDEYAERLLRQLSTVEYTINYSHAYCPVRIGDCVRLNYNRAGISNIKAKVISQTITCETGCKVSEKAVFTTKLWR